MEEKLTSSSGRGDEIADGEQQDYQVVVNQIELTTRISVIYTSIFRKAVNLVVHKCIDDLSKSMLA